MEDYTELVLPNEVGSFTEIIEATERLRRALKTAIQCKHATAIFYGIHEMEKRLATVNLIKKND